MWLNLPAASKMVDPHFTMLWKDTIPQVVETDSNGRKSFIDVISGNYKNQDYPSPPPDSWAANPANGVHILTIKIEANAKLDLATADVEDVNRSLYFYRGCHLNIEGQRIDSNYKFDVNPKESITIENGNEDAYLLLLQGKPINEPVAKHGPFVMNTQEELQQAFADYRKDEFGGWPWPQREQVHAKDKGRFALHANGELESLAD